jgi:hypothetical protein
MFRYTVMPSQDKTAAADVQEGRCYMRNTLVIFMAAVLAGCTSTPVKTASVEILSQPPGARIEVNDDYVGITPCTASIPANIMGEFTRDTTIRATSDVEGLRVQTKHFSGGFEYGENDIVPRRILFEMAGRAQ